jgi:hypothetical protein
MICGVAVYLGYLVFVFRRHLQFCIGAPVECFDM